MSNNPSKHTPAPWRVDMEGTFPDAVIVSGEESIATVWSPSDGSGFVSDRAARIVACVNACEGIEDPAAALAAARRLIDQCSKGEGFTDENGHRLDMNVAYIALRDALGKG